MNIHADPQNILLFSLSTIGIFLKKILQYDFELVYSVWKANRNT